MTTPITYTVSLGYCAEDWDDGVLEDGSPNFDTQPTTTRTVSVSLPADATPFDIYCEADTLIDDAEVQQELNAEGGSGLDGDGIAIVRNDTNVEYSCSFDSIQPTTGWDKFYQRALV